MMTTTQVVNDNDVTTTKWRLTWLSVIVSLIAVAGTLLLLYPPTAAWVSQYNQSKLISSYSAEVSSDLHPTAAEHLAQAKEYNAKLQSGAYLGVNERIPIGDGEAGDDGLNYFDMLNTGTSDVMARLRIPAIDVDLPIYHGTDDNTLLKGVGHLQGTSLPIGGQGTHSVLTAHRGLASATLFNNLNKVEIGDTFTVEVFGEVITYKVTTTKVVEPHETESLYLQASRDLITLVTCTPLGVNSHRILVTGERITPTPLHDIETADETPDIPGFPWWAVGFAGAFTLIGLNLWHSGKPAKKCGPNAS